MNLQIKKHMNYKLLAASIFLIQLSGFASPVITETTGPTGLKHPGCLQSAAEINALATALALNDPYRDGLWNSMMSNTRGRVYNDDWIPPTDLFGTDFASPAKYAGAGLIRYINDWIINGNSTSEAAAITMLNTWAGVQSWIADPDDGYMHHRLQSMWFGYLAHAGDLLISSNTSWPVTEQDAFKNTVQTIFLPIANDNRAAGFNANWDMGATWAVMAMAILLDDKALFDEQIAWLKDGETNARISYYLLSGGQNQESARDQGHAAMGLTFLSLAAQTAWSQGTDLYEYDNRSVGKAFEYFDAYNMGEDDLPFQVYPCAVGSNSAHDLNTAISDLGRPTYYAVHEMLYHHYKNYRDTELQYAKQMLENHTRPEAPGPNWSNHNSALYWNLDLSADAALRNAQSADVTLNINTNYAGRASLRLNCGGAHYGATDGRAFSKEKGDWQSGGSNVSHSNPIAGTTEEALYQTYRQGNSTGSIYYHFGLPNGDYRVILHFAEPTFTQSGSRVLNVYLEGSQTLANFDIYAVAGKNTAYIHETTLTLTDGQLDVQLQNVNDRAIISAIEIEPNVNSIPLASNAVAVVEEDDSVAITLTGSDADGDSLTYAVETDPANGALSGTAPNLTYTPNADYSGSDSFTFTVSDGAATSTAATVSITVSTLFDLIYTAGTGGAISGVSTQTVYFGADGSAVTAIPDTGYLFVNWSDASTNNPRTDLAVTSDITVTASFQQESGPVSITTNSLSIADSAKIAGGGSVDTAFDNTGDLGLKDATGDYMKIALFKADLSTLSGTVEDASLSFLSKNDAACNIYVWGVVDSEATGWDWAGGVSGDVTWNSVIANGLFTPKDHLYSTYGSELVLLGTFAVDGTISPYNLTHTVSGTSLVNLLNADTDDILTFVVALDANVNLSVRNPVTYTPAAEWLVVTSSVDVDTDGDGLTDAQEIALGTDPDDPDSGFGIDSLPLPSAGKIQIMWPSATGVLYRILESPNLADWTVARDWAAASTPPEDMLEFDLSPSNGFFRVEADIQ